MKWHDQRCTLVCVCVCVIHYIKSETIKKLSPFGDQGKNQINILEQYIVLDYSPDFVIVYSLQHIKEKVCPIILFIFFINY